MDDTLTQYGAGHSGENFSVEREKNNLKADKKIKNNYSVLLTDNAKRKFAQNDKLVHHSKCYREPMAKELYDWLIENGLKNLGVKKDPKKTLIHVYIIDKG